jgi:hypothetical protein
MTRTTAGCGRWHRMCTRIGAVTVAVAALAGCGQPGNYIADPNGDIVVAIPSGWQTIDGDAVLTLTAERAPVGDKLILSRWVAGFSAGNSDDAASLITGNSRVVGGVVRARYILSSEVQDLELITVSGLLGQMNDLALLPDGAELVARRGDRALTSDAAVNGLVTELEFNTADGAVKVRYLVAVDVVRGQLYSLVVGCSAACYDANVDTIDAIAESFTIVAGP